jgi:hypothetical protein
LSLLSAGHSAMTCHDVSSSSRQSLQVESTSLLMPYTLQFCQENIFPDI